MATTTPSLERKRAIAAARSLLEAGETPEAILRAVPRFKTLASLKRALGLPTDWLDQLSSSDDSDAGILRRCWLAIPFEYDPRARLAVEYARQAGGLEWGEIGELMGVSKQCAEQECDRALRKLRARFPELADLLSP